MKTWQFWVIILVVVLVIVPLIYFAIVAKSVTEVEKSAVNASILSGIDPDKQLISSNGFVRGTVNGVNLP